MSLSERTFGVEIEHLPGPTEGYGILADLEAATGTPGWHSAADGAGMEIMTPVLTGDEGLAVLEKAYAFLLEKGAKFGPGDGAHVHHGVPEYWEKNTYAIMPTLYESWFVNQLLIESMVKHTRRGCNPWGGYVCKPLTEADLRKTGFLEGASYYDAPRARGKRPQNDKGLQAINFDGDHKTIEVRLFHGTPSFAELAAWITFTQKLVEYVINRGVIAKCDTAEELCAVVGLDPEAIKVLTSDKAPWTTKKLSIHSTETSRRGYEVAKEAGEK